eukprot:XP_011426840.1 PREDICTED: receptor-type tyrosine-protein phosphatase mu-like isoform X2 [Crassostrea gigas]
MAATERVLLLALVFRNIFAYDNLALNRPSSFEPFQTAAPGNDGNPSTCITMSPTATSVARFVVEFASSRTIQEVNVTFPSGGTGMEGFFISISNSSELDSGYICYRSKLNVIPPSSNTYPCVGTGNYLTVYNRQRDGPIDFDICEVAVTGCSYQRFGYDCSQTCSCPGECHFETGECITPISVCNITGRWGENCNEVCGFCKDGAACDMSTGSCPAGCSAGYRTSKCTVECIGGTFGEDCQKSCGQCKNSRCNPVTGECDNTGCNTGYIGASCFNSNTFYNNQNGATSLAWQGNVATGSINYNGQILTDERLSSCVYQAAAFTNTIGSSSVQVTLTKERMIRELVLSHYPEGVTGPTLSNMAGFKILISNGVTVKDCFNWTSSDVPKQLQTVTCVGLAKVITIINTRSIGTTYPSAWGPNPGLAFCEIAAIGCPEGKFGTYCEKDCICPLCDYVTGACNNIDQNCQMGMYGVNCVEKCGNCKNNETCDIVNGTCPNGCAAGYNGTVCKDACLSGYYGENCVGECSKFCRNNSACEPISGNCPTGCSDGYLGANCSQICESGTYGMDCMNNCSRDCRGQACNHISGTCTSCNVGYRGQFCTDVCSPGTYGQDCVQLCACTNNQTCDHMTGQCPVIVTTAGTVTEPQTASASLSTDDLAMLICLVLGVITLIIAVIFIIIAARANKRFKQEAEEDSEEKQNINKHSDEVVPLSGNGHVPSSHNEHLVQVQGPFPSAPKPAPPVTDDGGLYFGVDDLPAKTEDYYNSSVLSSGVSVPDLKERIKNGQKMIEDEFKELQKGAIHPCTIANKVGNKPKNRYLTVLPYDHSIVQLTPLSGKPDTNYINGSYIDSTLEDKAYIATQGPMTSTIGDFWRMVWQTCCGKIVMLTNLKEKNKIKCAQYWPNKGSTLEFGLYKISVQAEKTHITYVQRALRLEDMTTSECRTIHHFHYTAWPDHGTPDHVRLVAFHHLVSSEESDFIGPMVVHCSAGIGRTGTFIALDSLLKQAKLTNQVQVFNFVKHMRKDRMNMIQTADQYMYVYHTIYEALNMKNSTIKRKDFPKEHFKLEDPSFKAEKRTVAEFRTLQEMRGVFTADNLNPKPKRKGRKSQDNTIVETLQTIKVLPYGDSRGFLLVQSLMPTMDTDLWNLVMTSESAVVVSVDKQSSDILGSFLPTSGEIRVTNGMAVSITSSAINENVNASCSAVDITNKNTEQSDEMTVIRACIDGKNPKMTPTEMANLAILIEHTEKSSSLVGPTIVLSSDGISSPGLLCVVSYAIQDAIKEKTVNLFQTVRQFHIRHPEFIATKEDYDFCYHSVYEFLLTDNDYANVDNDQE